MTIGANSLGAASLRVLADTSAFETGLSKSIKSVAAKASALFAGIGVGEIFKNAIKDARDLERVVAQTNAVIKSTGGVAGISAGGVSELAKSISELTGIEDDTIQTAENLLLTFTNVRNVAGKGNDIFNQTTKTVTDMAAALNNGAVNASTLKSSSILVGKALQDPIKGLTSLIRVGVAFTTQQRAQIKALVASGDTLGAQKIILAELSKEFGGSAAAIATPADKARAAIHNLSEQLGTYLIPIINRAATWLSTVAVPAMSAFLDSVKTGPGVFAQFRTAVATAVSVTVALAGALAASAGWLRDHQVVLQIVFDGVVLLTGAFVAYKAVLLLTAAAQGLMAIKTAITVAALIVQTATTEGLAAAWLVLDAAMDANPIGLVIAALALLAAGLVLAWNQSETFRDVVTNTWNAIVTAVGFAVKAQINLMAAYAEAPLRAFDLVLKGLAHLPSWLGGGVAAGAEGAVSALIGQIESWRNSAINAIDDVVNAAKLIPAQFNDAAGWNQDAGSITAELAKQGITQASMDALTKPKAPTGLPGGGGGGSTGTSAANAAKTHAAALKKLSADGAKFAKVTSKTTVDSLKGMFDTIKADYKALGDKVPTAISKIEASLLKAAKAEDKMSAALKTAKDNLQTLKNTAADYVKQVAASTSLDITSSASVGGIQFRMGQMVARTRAFVADITKLKSEGLSPTLLQQLISAGPLDGFAAAEALAGASLGELSGINAQQTALEGLGAQLGSTAYDAFFKSGIDMATGIVKGLESQEALAVKAVETFADKLSKALAKANKAHSPSLVYAEHGANMVAGLVQGIEDNSHKALSAVGSLGAFTAGAGGIGPVGNDTTHNITVDLGEGISQAFTIKTGRRNRATVSAARAGSSAGVVRGAQR